MIKSAVHFHTLLIFLLLGVAGNVNAQDEKFKAIFIYNFTKYVNWPQIEGSFIISILGNSAITGEIESIAAKKTVGTSAIEIRKVNTVKEITKCHILYVTADKTSLLPLLYQKSRDENILLVTERQDACSSGAGINFISKNGKLVFEISKPNIESCGLQISTDLIKLGIAANN